MIRIEPPKIVVDPYLEGISRRGQQELPLVVVHAPTVSLDRTPTREDTPQPWALRKCGYDRGYVYIDGTFTRAELFRFIGELERMAASL